MTQILTMTGELLMTPEMVLKMLSDKLDEGNVVKILVATEAPDGTISVYWTHQTITSVVMMARVITVHIDKVIANNEIICTCGGAK